MEVCAWLIVTQRNKREKEYLIKYEFYDTKILPNGKQSPRHCRWNAAGDFVAGADIFARAAAERQGGEGDYLDAGIEMDDSFLGAGSKCHQSRPKRNHHGEGR